MGQLIKQFVIYLLLCVGGAVFGFVLHDYQYNMKQQSDFQKELQREIEEDHSELLPEQRFYHCTDTGVYWEQNKVFRKSVK